MTFQDRHSAGRQLGNRLSGLFKSQPVIVVGLTNGGVPVGFEIARSLGAPLDVFFVRPDHVPEHFERRERHCRMGRHARSLSGRVVIVADDGVATGATVRGALIALRGAGAHRLVVAVPVAAQTALDQIHELADAVVCLRVLPEVAAIGLEFQHFGPVTDEDIQELLDQARTSVRHRRSHRSERRPRSPVRRSILDPVGAEFERVPAPGDSPSP